MGLNHPRDMDAWRRWEASRHRLRRAKHALADRVRRSEADRAPARWQVFTREGVGAPILVAIDSLTPTSKAALLDSLAYLRSGVLVVAPATLPLNRALADAAGGQRPTSHLIDATPEELAAAVDQAGGAKAVVSLGHHLPVGELVHNLARSRSWPSYVVQHGALTPYTPPLPQDTTLLAWSAADADFWTVGRHDVRSVVVGSQLLWQAGHRPHEGWIGEAPVFLGQMHGIELPRRLMGRAALRFCRDNDAAYRPHPSEKDIASRLRLDMWKRFGLQIAPTDVPLSKLDRPVVAVFSTGVLESAARGIASWVYCPGAPAWVREFWDRYNMRAWGGEPTSAPVIPEDEPAVSVAQILDGPEALDTHRTSGQDIMVDQGKRGESVSNGPSGRGQRPAGKDQA
ncbi:hypothetical protein [Devriesea agamarum]|uniref:hypothetical protein n=1 Tax=Devriesea agamarum TaxID=472569 RepID=UPI00071DE32C|nr:hypothetical protein [Devriesea agamarum]